MERLFRSLPLILREKALARVLQNWGALTLLQALNYILPLVSLPFLLRVLGLEAFGAVSFVRGVMLVLFLIVDYGFNYSAVRQLSTVRDDCLALNEILGAVSAARLAVTVVVSFAILFLCAIIPKLSHNTEGFVLSLGSVLGYALAQNWFFQAIEKMGHLTAVNGAGRLLFLALIVLYVRSPADQNLVIGLEAISYLSAGFFSLYLLRRELAEIPKVPRPHAVLMALKEGWHYFLTTAAISSYTALITPVLGLLTGNVTVAVYVAAERPVRAVTALIGPLIQALYPYMSRLGSQQPQKIFAANRRIFLISFVGMGFVSAAIYGLSGPVVRVLYRTPSIDIIRVMQILAPLPLLISCGSVALTLGVLVLGNRRGWSRTIYAAAIVGLCSLFILVRLCGLAAEGAALSGLLAEGVVTIAGVMLLRSMRSSSTTPVIP